MEAVAAAAPCRPPARYQPPQLQPTSPLALPRQVVTLRTLSSSSCPLSEARPQQVDRKGEGRCVVGDPVQHVSLALCASSTFSPPLSVVCPFARQPFLPRELEAVLTLKPAFALTLKRARSRCQTRPRRRLTFPSPPRLLLLVDARLGPDILDHLRPVRALRQRVGLRARRLLARASHKGVRQQPGRVAAARDAQREPSRRGAGGAQVQGRRNGVH